MKLVSRSGFERKIQADLKAKGIKFKYESQTLAYKVPASVHRYVPDFELPNGIIVEAKGNFDRTARKKMELVIAQHPDKDIRMLFMRDNTISKKSRTTYSSWCEKRNIKYHVSLDGIIPQSWLE